jgi:hypothetical protein
MLLAFHRTPNKMLIEYEYTISLFQFKTMNNSIYCKQQLF